MPPIPIHTQSPINPAKASGVTPQTREAAPDETSGSVPATTTTAGAASENQAQPAYPPARPGAVPSLPVPTATAGVARHDPSLQPTPTRSVEQQGPPPPQPGAVPVPPGHRHAGAPPPTATGAPSGPPSASFTASQLDIPAPAVPYAQRGTASAAAPNTEHPGGYRQNANASEFSSQQRAAHDMFPGPGGGVDGDEDEAGVWDSAKKWAQTAGEKLSAAESEVWRRINK
ncbi:hypothetical protein VTK73DRAFT_4055 [Phialemonium thermophilum]|uniref:Uncharacterized protein n=1 Tax=Phialemonium thermophilum TaxID=223376 RepID=A0ABR3VCB2_9PEZI